jgi:hypothetical protein
MVLTILKYRRSIVHNLNKWTSAVVFFAPKTLISSLLLFVIHKLLHFQCGADERIEFLI